MKIKFPRIIAVTIDGNGDGPIDGRLLAWGNIDKADEGRVAIYELVDEFETKLVTKKRRVGSKNWFE